MITGNQLRSAAALAESVKALYREGQTDYTLEPIVLCYPDGKPLGCVADGDAVVFCCRRGEREIQLTEAFIDPKFDAFPRPRLNQLDFVILTLYHEKFKDLPVAFAPSNVKDTLGEVVSRAGLRQVRISESEKFAHVTFFLNGGNNQPFSGEVDVRVPSPTGIPYNNAPALSLPQVAGQVFAAIRKQFDLIVVNFANGDVIGHTASSQAKIKCAEVVDEHLGKVIEAAQSAGYVILITADHGNLEEMVFPDGTPHVSHTTNRVPFILIDPRTISPVSLNNGSLADIAPTILSVFSLEQPVEMTGVSLAPGYVWGKDRRALLIILDGWGLGQPDDTNPIFLAHTPIWDTLLATKQPTSLRADGEAVGLKPGKAGNSEAGHMNIGAGRVVLQDDVRLDQAMQDGSFYNNAILSRSIEAVWQRSAHLHLIGLLTEKSSHGCIEYPLAILRMARQAGLQDVFLHLIFDGRSTEPGSAPRLLQTLQEQIDEIGVGQVATGVGRGIALDRNGNYAKTRLAYEAMVYGHGIKCILER
jgi:2,3-bisphosphoglycerate-independent phosphoglycerate mutase